MRIIKNTIELIDNTIYELIITIANLEKKRSTLLSKINDNTIKTQISSLEKSQFYYGPPKILHITIPSLPVSLNRSCRNVFARGKNVYTGLFEWWNTKIKNAIKNMELIDNEYSFSTFDKAAIIVKFNFPDDILRDIDNFAIKAINDSLEKNNIIKNDNKDVLQVLIPILEAGEKKHIDIFITDSEPLFKVPEELYNKYDHVVKKAKKNGEYRFNIDQFFANISQKNC